MSLNRNSIDNQLNSTNNDLGKSNHLEDLDNFNSNHNNHNNLDNNNDNNEEKLLKYKISHLVSANRLKLYIRIELINSNSVVLQQDIMDYIKEQGIIYGIKENDIVSYCKSGEFSKELVAATGIEPVDGEDAKLVYDFDTSNENKLEEKEDGTIDFFNLNNIVNVKKGDLLCHIIPEKEGIDGIDIYANKISYKKGKKVYFNSGKNTYITDDGLQLCSCVDGCVKTMVNKVVVDDVYTVNNVDNETGNIDFIGSVVINGDVKSGFTVKAKQDVKVRGTVQGAFIEAGGDVVISKGMNGMGKGTIYAMGNITSKYLENSVVESEKNIYSEMLINSDVTAQESIILKGHNAAIIGGTSKACNMIYAPTIGSKSNYETNLIIDLCKYQEKESKLSKISSGKMKLKKCCSEKYKELKDLEEKMSILLNCNIENKNILHKSLIFKISKVKSEISEIEKELKQDTKLEDIKDHKIVCKGIVYVNTRICIGWMKYKVRQDISYSKIYNDGSDIAIVPLNPSDIIGG